MTISILGAGAFGTALAISLARSSKDVILWTHDQGHAEAMQSTRQNTRRLKGITLPDSIIPTADLGLATRTGTILLAVPAQALAEFAQSAAEHLDGKPLVACCKGIDLASGRGPAEILRNSCPNSPSQC